MKKLSCISSLRRSRSFCISLATPILVLVLLPVQLCRAQTFSSETWVNSASGGEDSNTSPSITSLPDGNFIVAWHDDNGIEGSPTTGWGRIYSSDGAPTGEQFSLNPNGPGGWQYGHVVAALLPDNSCLPSGFASFWGWDSGAILGQQFNSTAMPVGDDFLDLDDDDWPAAATLANGNAILNVDYPNSGGGSVLVALFDACLTSYQTITANINAPGVGLGPSIAAAPNGNFTPAWWNATGNVIIRTFNSDGTATTSEVTVNSAAAGSSSDPSLAYNSKNRLWIAWQGCQSSTCNIYMRQFASNGKTAIGPELVVNQNTSADDTVPQLAVGGPHGAVAVSWTSTVAGAAEVFARIFNFDGTPATDEFQVNQYTSGDQLTNWAGGRRGTFVSEEGDYIFTWYGTGADGPGVYMTVFAPTPTSNSVASSLNPSTFGESVEFTATVTSSGGTPTGTVTFKDGSSTLGTSTLSSGTATYSTSELSVGSHSIRAVYGGSTNFSSSISPVLRQVVNP